MKRIAFLAFSVVLVGLAAGARVAEADCSGAACTDCEQKTNGIASCVTVTYDASCGCSLSVEFPTFCILEGACDYTGGGGGGGTGGGGGGGTTCVRPAGSWCPPECSSCETVYWL